MTLNPLKSIRNTLNLSTVAYSPVLYTPQILTIFTSIDSKRKEFVYAMFVAIYQQLL